MTIFVVRFFHGTFVKLHDSYNQNNVKYYIFRG